MIRDVRILPTGGSTAATGPRMSGHRARGPAPSFRRRWADDVSGPVPHLLPPGETGDGNPNTKGWVSGPGRLPSTS
ncbi:hypothetical protein Ae168Ps1_1431 [Pseudonocardia sp. Ae168_Ps1]|nr:hypothetical protein Ae150APs1_1428 [Pseudonocardia sp. Ae150A_Ps1]OLL79025.1 hypothetical protein Ae168Ps1_1431 [Pseudonocardia sp. Ae168_Ps1]OLL86837.1 hypothetical protein Ae263Ps1_3892c [Pseudonocardia sp. Ae263_Ps1]OLL93119.1 hypothetical protein Ae356Ps1_3016 [Pseudonocardia sp. Ae356_Ps1]